MLFGMQFIKANSECEGPVKSNGHEEHHIIIDTTPLLS